MRHNWRINWSLTAGFSISLLIHAMIALAMGANVFPTSRATTPPTPKLDQPKITPGVDNSHTTTINWIGFEDPTPHQARLAATDQPALERGPDTPPSRELPPTSPAPVVETITPTPPAAKSTPTPVSTDSKQSPTEPTTQAQQTSPSTTTLTRPTQDASLKQAANPAKPTIKPTNQPTQQAAKPTPKPAPQQPASTKGGAKRESPPTSQTKPIEIKPGKPIAMKGLRIDTIAPKFTTITRLTATPRNPLVKLTFNTAGKVTLAEMLESSGYEGVDRPVKDALYNWRAHGVQLDELKKKDPKQEFSLIFRIILQ